MRQVGRSISPTRGRLFVLEGPDGVGKTTLAGAVARRLSAIGYPSEYHSFPGREPGSLGAWVYKAHHDLPSADIHSLTPDMRAVRQISRPSATSNAARKD